MSNESQDGYGAKSSWIGTFYCRSNSWPFLGNHVRTPCEEIWKDQAVTQMPARQHRLERCILIKMVIDSSMSRFGWWNARTWSRSKSGLLSCLVLNFSIAKKRSYRLTVFQSRERAITSPLKWYGVPAPLAMTNDATNSRIPQQIEFLSRHNSIINGTCSLTCLSGERYINGGNYGLHSGGLFCEIN